MMRWYVVEAFEGKDFDVCLRLAAARFRVWRPIDEIKISRRWAGRKTDRATRAIRKVPRFGRYLFLEVAMSDAIRWAISATPGVRGFICAAGSNEPAAVPSELIEFYRNHAPKRDARGNSIGKGDRVRIAAGPFADHEGSVVDIDKRGILRLEICIFGSPTPLIIEVGHVELVEQGHRPPIGLAVKAHCGRKSA
jgi:transcription antitermination factor NusG